MLTGLSFYRAPRCDQKTEQRAADEFRREHPGLKLVGREIIEIIKCWTSSKFEIHQDRLERTGIDSAYRWSRTARPVNDPHSFRGTGERSFLLSFHEILARRRDRDFKSEHYPNASIVEMCKLFYFFSWSPCCKTKGRGGYFLFPLFEVRRLNCLKLFAIFNGNHLKTISIFFEHKTQFLKQTRLFESSPTEPAKAERVRETARFKNSGKIVNII